jgi:hypothetical protein
MYEGARLGHAAHSTWSRGLEVTWGRLGRAGVRALRRGTTGGRAGVGWLDRSVLLLGPGDGSLVHPR